MFFIDRKMSYHKGRWGFIHISAAGAAGGFENEGRLERLQPPPSSPLPQPPLRTSLVIPQKRETGQMLG